MRAPRLVVLLLLLAVLAACNPHPNDHTLPGQVALDESGYTVTATFDKVDNLVPNSTVQHDDVVIGTVTRIDVVKWRAKVTMRLKKSEPVPSNARFTIGQKTLLGAQFIDVVDPVAPVGRLSEGAHVDQDLTGTYPETEKLLAAVSLLLNNGGLSQISDITAELNQTLDRRVPDARDLIDRLNELLQRLDESKGDIVTALEALNRLTGRLADERDVLATAVDDVGPGLEAIENQREQLIEATVSFGDFAAVTNRLVNLSRQSLLANLGALRPVLQELQRSGDALPRSLDFLLTVPFPVSSSDEALKGDYGNLFTTVDLSLQSLIGTFGGVPSLPAAVTSSDPVGGPIGADEQQRGDIAKVLRSPMVDEPRAQPVPDQAAPPTTEPPPKCGLIPGLLGGCR